MDMGDTLIHINDFSFNRSLNHIYELAYNPKIDKESFLNFAHLIQEELFNNRLYIEIKCKDYIRLLVERFRLKFSYTIEELEWEFANKIGEITYVNDVEEILKYFKSKNYKLIVLSNTMFSSNVITKQLNKLSLYFDEIIASGDYAARKPDKSFFELGIGRLNLPKEDIVYIGNDYFFDVYGANNAGLDCIWLNENNILPNDKYKCEKYKMILSYKELLNDGID